MDGWVGMVVVRGGNSYATVYLYECLGNVRFTICI